MEGTPIQKSPDQCLLSGFPRLIAASHVLHRSQLPRCPPLALTTHVLHTLYSLVKEPIAQRFLEAQATILTPARTLCQLRSGRCNGRNFSTGCQACQGISRARFRLRLNCLIIATFRAWSSLQGIEARCDSIEFLKGEGFAAPTGIDIHRSEKLLCPLATDRLQRRSQCLSAHAVRCADHAFERFERFIRDRRVLEIDSP